MNHRITDMSQCKDSVKSVMGRYDFDDRNFLCAECKAKCTVGSDGETEYGHRKQCRHGIGKISDPMEKKYETRLQSVEH